MGLTESAVVVPVPKDETDVVGVRVRLPEAMEIILSAGRDWAAIEGYLYVTTGTGPASRYIAAYPPGSWHGVELVPAESH